MGTVRLLTTAAVLAAFVCGVSGTQDIVPDKIDGRKEKNADEMQEMYTAFMMMKNVVSMMLMFVSPIIQIKGFGLSVLNTLLNIGRFVMQMQTTKRLQEMADAHAHPINMLPHVFHADHKSFMEHQTDNNCKNNHLGDCNYRHKGRNTHQKDQDTNHNDHGHQNDHEKDHATSVYIIKESSGNDHPGGNDHVSSWSGQPQGTWNSDQPSYPSLHHEQQWSPSQKLAYYAPPPGNLFFSRLGIPPGSAMTQASPPATIYDHGKLYPHYNHNLTGIR